MSMLKMVQAAVALALLISTGAPAAELTADMTTTESPIATRGERHSIRIGSEKVRYTASFAETLLSDEKGRPQASISATTYLREGVKDAHRPVLFAFNGGPGASSSPLHFGALGPRVWLQKGSSRELVDNADSLLDVADLVFIDPVGTGFSRLRPGGDPDRYWSIDGDAAAAADFIHDWLRDHGRSDAPVFIAGESYGGFRLATMAPRLDDLQVAGLIFVSPMLDASASAGVPGNDLPFVFELPTLAAAAWYHEKIDRAGRSVEQFYDEAARFAQSEYLVALQQGSTLPDAARKQIAARMSQLIGLPAETIEASNLRMDSEQFLRTLLADKNLLLGRLDVRVTAPKPATQDPNRPPAADDPALGLKGSNVIRSELIKNYLRDEVGVNTARDYLSLTLDVNFRWNWQTTARGPRFYINPTTHLAALMQKQPQTRLLLLGGYYDLATPLLAPRHALSHAQLPWDKVTIAAFDAGHSPFEGEGNRSRVVQVVRAFVTKER
jgi:carboxypeptidase C (cathepsin A)